MPGSTCDIFEHDATTLTTRLAPGSVQAIITEPFLGKPLTGRESPTDLTRQLHDLQPLYEKTLAIFRTLIDPQGTVVMVAPRYRSRGTWITLPMDTMIRANGFIADPLDTDTPFLLYARPTQNVGREIWRLRRAP